MNLKRNQNAVAVLLYADQVAAMPADVRAALAKWTVAAPKRYYCGLMKYMVARPAVAKIEDLLASRQMAAIYPLSYGMGHWWRLLWLFVSRRIGLSTMRYAFIYRPAALAGRGGSYFVDGAVEFDFFGVRKIKKGNN